jgi:aldose sugar dehydrogenase
MRGLVGFITLIILIGVVLLGYFLFTRIDPKSGIENFALQTQTQVDKLTSSNAPSSSTDSSQVTVIAEGLDTPWAIAFLPDGGMLVTERAGRVRLVDPNGKLIPNPVATLPSVKESGEGGLHGITLHPDFASNNYVYLYYTFGSSGNNTLNRVVRMTFKNNRLSDEQVIVDNIPGASNHDGGRIKFGPDKFLYITTGDAQEPSLAQDRNSLAGKILRVTDVGMVAPGNPFNTQIYSYGHRNPQGITWDNNGQLWETEHGPSGGSLGTGNDEVNRIEAGKNYGWPEIQGDQTRSGMEAPARHSGTTSTWAPGGVAFINNSLFFGGLRGQALYESVIQNGRVSEFKEHFKGQFGRIREVITGPDGMLYITTSNKDGRGNPSPTDDRIIKVNPQKF